MPRPRTEPAAELCGSINAHAKNRNLSSRPTRLESSPSRATTYDCRRVCSGASVVARQPVGHTASAGHATASYGQANCRHYTHRADDKQR